MVEIKEEDLIIQGYDKNGGDWCPETEKDSSDMRDFHLFTKYFNTFNEAKHLKQQILQDHEDAKKWNKSWELLVKDRQIVKKIQDWIDSHERAMDCGHVEQIEEILNERS